MWLDIPRPAYPALAAPVRCELLVVGGGYAGLWTALHAAQRNPVAASHSIEAERMGWAASGRNGGFVEASITHGAENGKSRWPNEFANSKSSGWRISTACRPTSNGWASTSTGNAAACFRWPPRPIRCGGCEMPRSAGEGGSWTATRCARRWIHRRIWRAVQPRHLCDRQSGEAGAWNWRARAGGRCHDLRADRGDRAVRRRRWRAGHHYRRHHLRRPGCVGHQRFSQPLRRNRLYTVPVYDYVLSTEPLTDEQLGRIGWQGRQGIGDSANQFHYYRLSADNRIVWGGYDAIYHFGRKVDPAYEHRPQTYERLAAHFFLTFPQLEESGSVTAGPARSTPTRDSARTGAPPTAAASPTSTGSPAWESARRGSLPTCVWTCSTVRRHGGPGWRWCATNRCRFHRNRWPASGFRQLAGRSTKRTTARESAIYS